MLRRTTQPHLQWSIGTLLLSALFLLMGCEANAPGEANTGEVNTAADTTDTPTERPAEAWWAAMQRHCGNAYLGGLTLEPEGDEMLDGDERLIAHFRVCEENRMEIPFHIETADGWDRSRTWILTRHDDRLELRHDHRQPGGTDAETTMYGGFTTGPGSTERQEFLSRERTEETGLWRGWRLEVEADDRYTYGTVRDVNWSWRIDFDLSDPMEQAPPAPWGHEEDA